MLTSHLDYCSWHLTDFLASVPPPSIFFSALVFSDSSRTLVTYLPFLYFFNLCSLLTWLSPNSLAWASRHFRVYYLGSFLIPYFYLLPFSPCLPFMLQYNTMLLVSQAFHTIQHSLPLFWNFCLTGMFSPSSRADGFLFFLKVITFPDLCSLYNLPLFVLLHCIINIYVCLFL